MALTHGEYCRNKEARLNASYTIFPDGVIVYQYGGEYFTEKEFNDRFPVTGELINWRQKKHAKGENPNKKNNFKTL